MTTTGPTSTSGGAPAPDPFAAARKLLSDLESQSNAAINRAMNTDAFVALSGRSSNAMLVMQALMGQWIPRWLAMLHVPSSEEINQLGERLQAIEDQLRRIEDASLCSPAAREQVLREQRANRPAKTRRPPVAYVAAPAAAVPAGIAVADQAKAVRGPRKSTARKTVAPQRNRGRA